MAVAWAVKTENQQGTSSQNYTTASTTPVANRGYLLWVASGLVGAAVAPTTVTGMGMTWTLVASQPTANSNVCLSLWRALSATPGTGAITMAFSVAHTGCAWKLLEGTGVPPTAGGAGMIRAGSVVSGNSTSSAPALTLPSGAVQAGNGVMCGIDYNAAATQTLTAGSGFVKIGADIDTSGSPAQLLSVEVPNPLPGSSTVGWTTSNSNNKSLIAFEYVGASVAVTVNAGVDQTADAWDTVSITPVASGGTAPYTLGLTQISGSPTVVLTRVGNTWTFTAPGEITGSVLTFRATAVDAGSNAAPPDDVVVTCAAGNLFTQRAGILVPRRPYTRRAGNLVG